MKDLQILVSKKGTKVVTATSLYMALQLPDQHYAANIKKWLTDVYEFKDGSIGSIKGAGGLTPVDASEEDRAAEAVHARSWFKNITNDMFG